MTILVTGATGMVGSVLCKRLQTLDIPHLKLSRHPSHSSEDQVFWDPHERILETEKLREVETVIHLAGEPVGKRWTHEIKKKIIFSRSDAGRFLFETLAAQDKPPKTLISASGIGFYGVANETKFNEESAKVVVFWQMWLKSGNLHRNHYTKWEPVW